MNLTELLNKKQDELNNAVKDIDSLIYRYPYFAHAQILKAKVGFQTNSILFADNLAKAALLTMDRTMLFRYIFEEIYFTEISITTKNTTQADSQEIPKDNPVEDPNNETNLNTKDVVEINTENETNTDIEIAEPKDVIKRKYTRKTKSEEKTEGKKQEIVENLPKTKIKEELIEKFIKTNPSVSKPGNEDYSKTEEQAKKSLEENLDFVSETLAEIYLKQGNKDKAIKIFQQLMVKIPEKKLYFAAQIKKLE